MVVRVFGCSGVVDIAVGAPYDDDDSSGSGALDKGAVYILFLNTDGTVKGERKLSDTSGFGLAQNDFFGISVASIGDLNQE